MNTVYGYSNYRLPAVCTLPNGENLNSKLKTDSYKAVSVLRKEENVSKGTNLNPAANLDL